MGTDAKILDLAVRLFPHTVYNPWVYKWLLGGTLLGVRFVGKRVIALLVLALAYLFRQRLQQAASLFTLSA